MLHCDAGTACAVQKIRHFLCQGLGKGTVLDNKSGDFCTALFADVERRPARGPQPRRQWRLEGSSAIPAIARRDAMTFASLPAMRAMRKRALDTPRVLQRSAVRDPRWPSCRTMAPPVMRGIHDIRKGRLPKLNLKNIRFLF